MKLAGSIMKIRGGTWIELLCFFKAGTTDSVLPKAGRAVLDRYESGNWSFVADLWVNPVGFVFDYPGIWMVEGEA
jgi:hypothetical protein